jgi:HSP20 family protein
MAYVMKSPSNQSVTARDLFDRWFESAINTPWLSNAWGNSGQTASSAYGFPVDIYKGPDSYVVVAALPGVNPDQVQVTALNGMLTIAAEVKPGVPEGSRPLYREMTFGQFRRDVRLPGDFAIDKADATYEGGMLKLTLPKAEHLKPKTLRINTVK